MLFLLACAVPGTAVQRNMNTDSCPMRRRRFEREVPTDQPQPFAHTYQTKTASCLRRLEVESCAGVGNAKIYSILMARHLDLGFPGSAVFYNILQSLLDDPEKAQRHIFRDLCPNVTMNKLDSQVLLLGNFPTVVSHCRHQPKKV